MKNKINVIIPTQFYRLQNIENLLFFLSQRNIDVFVLFERDLSVPEALKSFGLVNYVATTKSSAASKRNEGLSIVANKSFAEWTIFIDDDFKLDDEFDKFLISLNELDPIYLGAGTNFNYGNIYKSNDQLKKFKLFVLDLSKWMASRVGIYPCRPMSVSASGWHRSGMEINRECDAEWLHSGLLAVRLPIIRRLESVRFPPFDAGSYLEDLWFTYHLSQYGRLRFFGQYSFETKYEDKSSQDFGFEEVVNRYEFVKFFNLSILRFYLMVACRASQSLAIGTLGFRVKLISRFLGNINAIFFILR